jgi:lysophospholipase L1-like esterase
LLRNFCYIFVTTHIFYQILLQKITASFMSQQNTALRYLALGDSYTVGEGVNAWERWSHQLLDMLMQKGWQTQAPQVIAATGWTTAELLEGMAHHHLEARFDLVSLLIGVNNQYRQQALQRYREELKLLLDKAVALADSRPGRVFMLSIPDWGVTPFAADRDQEVIAQEIAAFNTAAQEICHGKGILFVDITPLSRKALAQPVLLASDALHYSGQMYGEWAREALPKVEQLLR